MNKAPEDQYYNPTVEVGLEKWLSSYWREDTCFIMSDIKKSGLTFNRHIHNTLMDVCKKVYPSFPWDRYKNYGNAKIYLHPGDEPLPMKNGYGLGMLDCVISFTQACIFQLLSTKVGSAYNMEAKFWSDDMVIKAVAKTGFGINLESLDMILQEYDTLATKCGLRIHEKKPYVSRKGVFLETYGTSMRDPWDHTKGCQWIGCLFDTLKAPTICRAKEIFATLCLEVPEILHPWVSTARDTIISYWGHEFTPKECTYPLELGGWNYVTEGGFNTLFWWLLDQEENPKLAKLINIHMNAKKTMPLSQFHRDNRQYIEAICQKGWVNDPCKLSWKTMARSTLYSTYSSPYSVLNREISYQDSRNDLWGQKSPKETMYGLTRDFWQDIMNWGWYLPPKFFLDVSKHSTPLPPKSCEKQLLGIDLMRCWHHISKSEGSTLYVADPKIKYSDYSTQDLMSLLLFEKSKGRMVYTKDLLFSLMYGYDLESVMKVLYSIVGQCTLKCTPETSMLEEYLKHQIQFEGEYCYPLTDVPRSVLTQFDNYSLGLKSVEDCDAMAIIQGQSNLSTKGYTPRVVLEVLKELLEELRQNQHKKKVVDSDPYIDETYQKYGGLDRMQTYFQSICAAYRVPSARDYVDPEPELGYNPGVASGYDDICGFDYGDDDY
jgi:hypothetical protein